MRIGVATGSASRASRLRAGAHAAVGAAGWLLLGFLWLWQFEADHVPSDWMTTVAVTTGGALAFAASCVGWVCWNRSIYRRRHNRRAPIASQIQFESDALGRAIVVSEGGRDASRVVIDIDSDADVKYYVVA